MHICSVWAKILNSLGTIFETNILWNTEKSEESWHVVSHNIIKNIYNKLQIWIEIKGENETA